MNGLNGKTGGFVLVVACALAGAAAMPAFAASGDLDAEFGGDGKVTTEFAAGSASAEAVVVQSDGRILAVGSAGDGFALARYRPDGSLDPSFGAGEVVTHFAGTTCGGANAVAMQMNGKIVAAGRVSYGPGCSRSRFALARYTPTGTLDGSFGNGGRVITRFGGAWANGVAVQSNGRIVVVGGGGQNRGFAVARYRTNGTLDATFSGDGKARNGLRLAFSEAKDVAIQDDGRIVAAGVVDFYGFAVARYNSNGTLDRFFSGDGLVATTPGAGEGGANSLAMQANGKIVVAGSTDGAHEGGDTFGPSKFTLVRYLPDGTLDPTFGHNGRVKTRFGDSGSSANAVTMDHGKIVAVGHSGGGTRFALARYDLDGTLDTSFSGDGMVTTPFKPGGAMANGVVAQDNGDVVAAGWSGQGFALARYLSS
jgi:uncharacterized delta-60 repeat protein